MTEPTNLWAVRRERLANAHLKALKDLVEHMGLPLASLQHEFVANGERMRVTILLEPAREATSGDRSR